jgi:hypothetical protein
MEDFTVLFEKNKEAAFNRDVTVGQNDFLGSDQKLGFFQGAMGRVINNPLQCDSIEAVEMGDVVGGMLWTEISMDRENSE